MSLTFPNPAATSNINTNKEIKTKIKQKIKSNLEDEATAAEALTMLGTPKWTNMNGTIPLSMKEDAHWLIPLHCFVRKHLHIFHATEKDLKRHNNGKAKPVQIGQIGIACPYCLRSFPRSQMKAGVYFPSTITNVYSASLNLLARHMPICEAFPRSLKEMFHSLKFDEGRSAASKKYWYDSAKKLGLVDTEAGIRYSPRLSPSRTDPNHAFAEEIPTIRVVKELVIPEDQVFTTEFIYYIMQQYQRCNLSEADRIGRRRSCPINFPGLECQYCQSNCGFGSRLFPTSFKSFSDTTKTIAKMNKHLLKCRDCPSSVKTSIEDYRGIHLEQKSRMRIGSLKAFCTRVWDRLHDIHN